MDIPLLMEKRNKGATWQSLARHFRGYTPNALRKAYYRHINKPNVKILLIDIETKPIEAHVWDIWQQNVGLNQIVADSSVMSFSAKWLEKDEIIYHDNRKSKDFEDDKKLCEIVWHLLDEADIVVGHYSKNFDIPKLFGRFLFHDMNKPSDFRQVDTKEIASKYFKLTSNKLEYLANFLKVKFKKLTDRKFAGHALWSECMKGNAAAWNEMQAYNIMDVRVLQEVYHKLKKWDKSINYDVYHDGLENICPCCGGKSFVTHKVKPFIFTNTGKFDRLICTNSKCGRELKGKVNLLSLKKRKSLKG